MKWLLLPLFWVACVAAGYLYTQQKGVSWEIARVVAPAFVLEATLFLGLALDRVRTRLETLPRAGAAGVLLLAAVAPYVVASVALGSFSWVLFGGLTVLVGVLAFWYVLLPHNPLTDAALLAFAGTVYLLKVFGDLYVRPEDARNLKVEALGQAMWIRTGLLAILSVRRVRNIGFGFWPEAREWAIGAGYFVGFLPLAAGLGWAIQFTRPQWPTESEWKLLPLIFFGTLWLLALGEELCSSGWGSG